MDDARNVWDEIPDWGGVGARRLVRAGTLGGSVWEFQPGQGQFVYHFHHASEELLVVLRGAPTVRLQDGDRELKEGDVVGFPRGAEGGHQIRNESDEVARVLIVSQPTPIPTSPSTTAARSASGSKVAADSSAWKMLSNTAGLSSGEPV